VSDSKADFDPSAETARAPNEKEETDGEKQLSDVEKTISDLEQQVKEKENRYLYLYAEFDNYKKRAIKERADLIKFAWEPAAREFLQVADNLERAIGHIPAETDKNLVEGLNLVLNQFRGILEKQGVKPIESLGTCFDPNLHEAVGQEDSTEPSGNVVKEHQKGYSLHGRLLRPARVVISSGKSVNPAQQEKKGSGG